MIYYYYCSFDGSGAGFLPGSVESGGKGIVSLSSSAYPQFILDCFESGEVRSAWGVLPDSGRYFILQKSLKTSRVDEGGGRKRNFYINISAVYDSYEEFAAMAAGSAAKDTLARAVLDSIVLDENDPFRYKVDTGKLKAVGGAFSVRACANGMPYPEPNPQDRRVFVLPTNPEISKKRLLAEFSCHAGQVSILSSAAKNAAPLTSSPVQTSGGEWEQICGPEKKSPPGWVLPVTVCVAGVALVFLIFWLASQPAQSVPAESQMEQPEGQTEQSGSQTEQSGSQTEQSGSQTEQQTMVRPSQKRKPPARPEDKTQSPARKIKTLVQSLAGKIKRLVPSKMKAKQVPSKTVWNSKTGPARAPANHHCL